jgi:hypothetical protein
MSLESLTALINSLLPSGSEIQAVDHRTVEIALATELFAAQSRGDVLAGVQSALNLSAGDKVFVIRSGEAYLLDANSFGLVSNLVDLSDVQITSPVNDQALVYDAGLSKYVLKDIFLDVSWQKPIISFLNFTTSEPASPTTGDRYVNTVTGSGSVSTGETFTINYIYEWSGAAWTETIPLQGYTLVNNDDSLIYNFNGTSWVAASSGALPSNVALKNAANTFSNNNAFNGFIFASRPAEAIRLNGVGDNYISWFNDGSNRDAYIQNSHNAFFRIRNETGTEIRLDIGSTNKFLLGITNSAITTNLNVSGTLTATSFTGVGSAITALNASNISTGTVADARLSSNVALKNINNNFSVGQSITGALTWSGTATGNGSGITNVNAATLGGTAIGAINTFHSVADLGTNQTAVSANSARELDILAGLYNASTTLTFSDVTNLRRCAIQITNTNANVLTFAGITVKFVSSELPSGMSFASNALTFPADTAVVYNIVLEKFNGTVFRGRIELD